MVEEEEEELTPELLKFLSSNSALPAAALDEVKQKGKLSSIEIAFKHSGEGFEAVLNYQEESRGTQRYFQLTGLLEMASRKAMILSIDELESSLHPDLLKHFLLSFLVNVKQSQLIVTTHLRELLNERDIFRKDAIWFTEKKPDGSTDLYSLDDFDSSVVRNTSSVYNAYKIGKLGATPNLGDYFIKE